MNKSIQAMSMCLTFFCIVALGGSSTQAKGTYEQHMENGNFQAAKEHAIKKEAKHERSATTYRETNNRIRQRPIPDVEQIGDNKIQADAAAMESYKHSMKQEKWDMKARKAAEAAGGR